MERAERRFRIWSKLEGKNLPHRIYSTPQNALDRALLLIRFEHVGEVFQVYDTRSGDWKGEYQRHANGMIRGVYLKGILNGKG